MDRKPFSQVFEGKNPKCAGTPEVTLRRFTDEDYARHDHIRNTGDVVGIFWAQQLMGIVHFDDLFDEEGNRFYND